MELHRDVSDNDTGNPTDTTGAVNCLGRSHAVIDVKLDGTDPSWDITPLFWNEASGQYHEGTIRTVVKDERMVIATDQAPYFYLKITGKAGTDPTIQVWVHPVNR